MKEAPVAGFDISKSSSDICVLAPGNEVVWRSKMAHTSQSMAQVARRLTDIGVQYGAAPVIIMEATGHYHRIVLQFMKNEGFDVVVVNPIQSGALKNISIRKVKNDRVDAYRIALLYRLKAAKRTNLPTDLIADLRSLCRQHYDLTQDLIAYRSRLHAQLDQCFPGFAGVFSSLVNLSALSVLERFPLPSLILSASDQDIEGAILSVVTRKSAYLQKKIHALRQAARNALPIAISTPSCAVIMKNLVSMLQILKKSIREVDLQIRALIRSDAGLRTDAELLKSIPGIADYAAAVILSEIGSVSSFQSAKQLVAFCGLDPTERQSGQFTGTRSKISKRGSKYLRCILNMSAHISIQPGCKGTYPNPVLAEYFQRKRQSKPYKSALCAVMHKIVNIIFAVLRDQKPFELRSPELHCQIMRDRAAKLSLAA